MSTPLTDEQIYEIARQHETEYCTDMLAFARAILSTQSTNTAGPDLRTAAKNLLDACYVADAQGELAGEIDGRLLDAVASALAAPIAQPPAPVSGATLRRLWHLVPSHDDAFDDEQAVVEWWDKYAQQVNGALAMLTQPPAPEALAAPIAQPPASPTDGNQTDPLNKLLELCDISDESHYGTLSVSTVRALVKDALSHLTERAGETVQRPADKGQSDAG